MRNVYDNDKIWTERTAGTYTAWTILWIVIDFFVVAEIFYFI